MCIVVVLLREGARCHCEVIVPGVSVGLLILNLSLNLSIRRASERLYLWILVDEIDGIVASFGVAPAEIEEDEHRGDHEDTPHSTADSASNDR